MKSIYNQVRSVEKVFRELEKELTTFTQLSGMHCLAGCGKCCKKPDIMATPLEFLPWAYNLLKTGHLHTTYEELKTSPLVTTCILFKPLDLHADAGFCGSYEFRGLICRLFGFAAMRDKYGNASLVTCKPIKNELPEAFARGTELAENGKIVFMRDYYFRLSMINPELGRDHLPINQALLRAMEAVLTYYSYRRIRRAS